MVKKCWKLINDNYETNEKTLKISTNTFAQLIATEEEINIGEKILTIYDIEKEYKVQVCSPEHPRPYYEMRTIIETVPFEELIFDDNECIGICHEELVFLFNDIKKYNQAKYLGEMIVGPDNSISFYDYYHLKVKTND